MDALTQQQQTELEAAAFRRLIAHLDSRKDVQNIDLMILAGFCRNCLSKWYKAAADELELDVSMEAARETVYQMSYAEWKANHQLEATPEQLAAMDAQQRA
ncbi:MAG: cell division protein DedD [Gammaproteobacteria bacterium]|nr:cell division protein DedD [Gammaproteobacteria bacterium]|tara:strand:- start:4243 stop:4545 length:303 start_codon:yes stop_codon:yes gene_type:complete